jgi:hypothetical protein
MQPAALPNQPSEREHTEHGLTDKGTAVLPEASCWQHGMQSYCESSEIKDEHECQAGAQRTGGERACGNEYGSRQWESPEPDLGDDDRQRRAKTDLNLRRGSNRIEQHARSDQCQNETLK